MMVSPYLKRTTQRVHFMHLKINKNIYILYCAFHLWFAIHDLLASLRNSLLSPIYTISYTIQFMEVS